jgi:ribonuclease-3
VSNETGCRHNNERLEFLGDSVLGVVVATRVYSHYPGQSEGEIAKVKSVVVSEDILSSLAREVQIDALLILGRGEEQTGGRVKKAILADAMEALIGALYLDQGYERVYAFVKRLLEPEIERVVNREYIQDYKSILQEECQRRYHTYPQYKLLKRSGPDHDRYFWIEVVINGKHYGPGAGQNKKAAEQEAARAAWEAAFREEK